MPDFTCDLDQPSQSFNHFWEHTIGSGHAPLALRADYQKQLKRCQADLGFQHVRFHGVLSQPMGTLLCENEKLLYSFFNADQITDFILSIGMRPFVELSFMPDTLSTDNTTVFHYRANVTPPNNYDDWQTLIHKLVAHWVDRYSLTEVAQWYFEVWNEPNLSSFWTGSQADYFKLYQHTYRAIKSIDASLQIGGPVTAQNAWIPEFLDYCDKNKLPPDFITTHYYPTDAFGKIGADTLSQLAHAPRDIMRQRAEQAHNQANGHPLYYTEWNISSNPRDPFHDEAFAATYATHIVTSVAGLVQGYSYWTFSDIFEENYFPSTPFQGGFGLLTIYGIPKPIYRAFQLLHQTGTERYPVEGSHETIEVLATKKDETIILLVTNHAAPRHPVETESVSLRLINAPQPVSVVVERIDDDHVNPCRLWRTMGKPEYLSNAQVELLIEESQLLKEPINFQSMEDNTAVLSVHVPPQSMVAITIEFSPGAFLARDNGKHQTYE